MARWAEADLNRANKPATAPPKPRTVSVVPEPVSVAPAPVKPPRKRNTARDAERQQERQAEAVSGLARVGRYASSFEGQPTRRFVVRNEEEARRLDEAFCAITGARIIGE